ncbi:MAG: MoxR family ATPase [Myxococcota bacterium]|jgi:MoxR-like ATPase|nr:MoxR family ATPase [Myxococcota bacterium]
MAEENKVAAAEEAPSEQAPEQAPKQAKDSKSSKEKKGKGDSPASSTLSIEAQVERFQADFSKLADEVGKMIVGQRSIIDGVLTCFVADGQVLLEGVPGLGKTMLVRTLSEAVDCQFSRIQFTPDMMPSDIIGTNMIVESEDGQKEFRFQRGPVFTNILLADEINRATPKTQSALLEAMQEKSVTVGTQTLKLDAPFFVLATQNPLEMEGTYPLPEAQLDRFLFKLNVDFPTRDELHSIMERTTSKSTPKVEAVIQKPRILEMRQLAREVPVAKHVMDYALKLVLATHPDSAEAVEATRRYVRFGSSPRGAQSIIMAAKIHALVRGRFNVSAEDIRHVALPSLRHRVILNFEGEAEGVHADQILQEILKKTAETKA